MTLNNLCCDFLVFYWTSQSRHSFSFIFLLPLTFSILFISLYHLLSSFLLFIFPPVLSFFLFSFFVFFFFFPNFPLFRFFFLSIIFFKLLPIFFVFPLPFFFLSSFPFLSQERLSSSLWLSFFPLPSLVCSVPFLYFFFFSCSFISRFLRLISPYFLPSLLLRPSFFPSFLVHSILLPFYHPFFLSALSSFLSFPFLDCVFPPPFLGHITSSYSSSRHFRQGRALPHSLPFQRIPPLGEPHFYTCLGALNR